MRDWLILPLLSPFLAALPASADPSFERGLRALRSMTGCTLVDYSYVETASLKPGYARDARVYDVNRDQSVKEWIELEAIAPNRFRLQHVLFATDLAGRVMPGSELRHQAEDWEYDAPFLYDFQGRARWDVKELPRGQGLWTRRITNLDDGLRYQCASPWKEGTAYAEWECSNYAPIPGRETRDMGRKDYDALERTTRLLAYGGSWLERQDNVKVIDRPGSPKEPLARETAKNWYVRLPDSECEAARTFSAPRSAFWSLLREAWDAVLVGDRPFLEKSLPGEPPRFARMMALGERYASRDLRDAGTREKALAEIHALIEQYRQ